MGSLKAFGALGGLGEGIVKMAEMKQEMVLDEKRTAREIALQGQRDSSSLERQREADKAASSRQKERYGPEGYEAAATEQAAGLKEGAAVTQHVRNVEIERIRQEGRMALDRSQTTSKTNPWSRTTLPGQTTITPEGAILTGESKVAISDNRSGITYVQKGLKYIPQGLDEKFIYDWDKNGGDKEGAEAWLMGSVGDEQARTRSDTFLRSFGYLPSSYFDKFAKYGTGGTTTTERARVAAPANP